MMLPMKHFPKLIVNPDHVQAIRAFKMVRYGDVKVKEYKPGWFGKLLGLKPRRAYRKKGPRLPFDGLGYRNPRIEFKVGNDLYTINCDFNDEAFRGRDEMIDWLNAHQTTKFTRVAKNAIRSEQVPDGGKRDNS